MEKDTGAFVKALIEAPPKTQLLGVSEWMAFDEWAALWSIVTGVKSKFEDNVSQEPLPPSNDTFDFKMMFLQTGYFVTEFGYTGGDPNVVGPEEVSCLHLIRISIFFFLKKTNANYSYFVA